MGILKPSRALPTLLAGLLLSALAGPAECQDAGAAQSPRLEEKLPLDPGLTVGRLPNGLAYFVRANSEPKARAEIWLAVNAGSVQEDDDQLGLAHFVEHMAFNGTRHFEKQQLVDYLEAIGMRFGPEVNAYTSFDETVYMLTLPTDDPEILEKGFLILEDWAHGVTFDAEEIDGERGVVVEEWRLGRGADARISDQQLPILFQGSRYAERRVIGSKEVLETAPHETLRRYYRDWYRPDLMAVIAVGDFDVERIVSLVHDHFGKLRGPETPRQREVYPVPDHAETLWTIATDPEATSTRVAVYYKLDKRPEETVGDYRRGLGEALYHSMLNARLDEVRRKPDPPFLFGGSSSGGFVRSRDVYFQRVAVPDGGLARGLEALLTEVERVDRHGFTQTELSRAREDLLRLYEQAYRERDKRESGSHASEIRRHFLTGEPMPGIERELELARQLLPGISLEELNHLADEWISESNRVIAVSAPEKAGQPAPDREVLQAVFAAVESGPVSPYVDRVRDEPLLAEKPQPGSIVERKTIEEIGVTEWRLSNGVRVVMKPTDFKNDEILVSGFSPGGHSLVTDAQHTSAIVATSVVEAGGLGEFDSVELRKALTGKLAGGSTYIEELEEGVIGGASPEDLETALQLLYLGFTAPRRDEPAFGSWLERTRAALENRLARPETVFADRVRTTLAQDHPRRRPFSPELLSEIDLDAALEVYRDRFADAGDFTFFLVGNFEPSAIEPLVLTYLGGLPSTGRDETWRDVGVRPPDGVVEVAVEKGLEPKSLVRIVFSGEAEWTRQNHHDIISLANALGMRLRELLREGMAGTYGVSVGGRINPRPRPSYSFSVSFGCSPENLDALVKAVFDEIARARADGFEQSYVAKVKEAQRRQRQTAVRENGFWRSVLASYYRRGEDPRLILAHDELVEAVSSETLNAAARRYLDTERYVLGTLRPEAGK